MTHKIKNNLYYNETNNVRVRLSIIQFKLRFTEINGENIILADEY